MARRCRYCGGEVPEKRERLRGHRRLFCCDEHHDADQRHEDAKRRRARTALKVRRKTVERSP